MGMLDDYVKALQNVPLQEAIPGGAGATPQGDSTMLSNMIGNIVGLPKKAIDASQRDIDNNALGDPNVHREVVGPAFETARALMGMGTPFAKSGTAGIFGGKLAKTADLDKLTYAQKMMKEGSLPEEVLNETQWFRSPSDRQWKFEIPDLNSRMMGHGLDYSKEGSFVAGPSSEMFQHPDLYKAYPELSKYKMYNSVYQKPKNGIGTGEFQDKELGVNSPNLTQARSVALHELQHGVQGIENFSPGGNPSHLARMQSYEASKVPLHELKSDPEDMYNRLSGEVESRLVQKRMDYPNDVRSSRTPWGDMDVPYQNQLSFNPQQTLLRALRR